MTVYLVNEAERYSAMAEFLNVWLLSVAMFIGCMLAGWIPLAFTLSQRKIQLFTIFGAGLLVGTALAVIIPEGVETMYSEPPNKHASDDVHHDGAVVVEEPSIQQTGQRVLNEFQEVEKHEHHSSGPHQAVGLALLLGFVFMLLVDQIGGHSHSHAPDNIRLDELNQSKVGTKAQHTDQTKKCHTATIGLVVHASADGIALGAAASTHRNDLQLIVFLAIMLHKAPAAFGLVSFLVHEGLELRKVKRHLLTFALAAPLLALITFLLLNQNDRQLLSAWNATGLAMLFSAGTFLYVATVHVLPEVSHSSSGNKKLSLCELLVLVFGCLLPLVLSIGHSH